MKKYSGFNGNRTHHLYDTGPARCSIKPLSYEAIHDTRIFLIRTIL